MYEFIVFLFLLIVNSKEYLVYAFIIKFGVLLWRNFRNSLVYGFYNIIGEFLINKIWFKKLNRLKIYGLILVFG